MTADTGWCGCKACGEKFVEMGQILHSSVMSRMLSSAPESLAAACLSLAAFTISVGLSPDGKQVLMSMRKISRCREPGFTVGFRDATGIAVLAFKLRPAKD